MRGQALAFGLREAGAGECRPDRLPEPGVVKHGPPVLRGRTVFFLYPHQTASVVPARAVGPAPHDAATLCTWLGDTDLRRQLPHAAEQRHVTRSGWSATADQIPGFIAEAV